MRLQIWYTPEMATSIQNMMNHRFKQISGCPVFRQPIWIQMGLSEHGVRCVLKSRTKLSFILILSIQIEDLGYTPLTNPKAGAEHCLTLSHVACQVSPCQLVHINSMGKKCFWHCPFGSMISSYTLCIISSHTAVLMPRNLDTNESQHRVSSDVHQPCHNCCCRHPVQVHHPLTQGRFQGLLVRKNR